MNTSCKADYFFYTDVVRATNAYPGRDSCWGRTEEYFGGDSWFNGCMVQAYVKEFIIICHVFRQVQETLIGD